MQEQNFFLTAGFEITVNRGPFLESNSPTCYDPNVSHIYHISGQPERWRVIDCVVVVQTYFVRIPTIVSERQNCDCPYLFDGGEGLVPRTIVLPDVGQPANENENGRRHLPATFCRESDLLYWRNSTNILWITQAAPSLLVISSLSITAWISVFRFVGGPGKSDDGPGAASRRVNRRSYLLVVNKSDRVGEIHPAMNQGWSSADIETMVNFKPKEQCSWRWKSAASAKVS